MKSIVLLATIFCHILDDYVLQGCLANLKQKKWWQENCPEDQYKYDYVMALLCHAFSWSFMVHLPSLIYLLYTNCFNPIVFGGSVLLHTLIHAGVDDLKANKLKINLIEDQLFHLAQISTIVLMFSVG